MVDASRAVLQQSQKGLQIIVPRRAPMHVERRDHDKASDADEARPSQGVNRETSVKQATLQGDRPIDVVQAHAQGVEVVEEEFPWPEKLADAAAGWLDNRGDFHEYGA